MNGEIEKIEGEHITRLVNAVKEKQEDGRCIHCHVRYERGEGL